MITGNLAIRGAYLSVELRGGDYRKLSHQGGILNEEPTMRYVPGILR